MLTLWSAAAGCNNRMPMCIGSFSLHSKWIGLSKRYPNSSVLRRDVESDRLIGNTRFPLLLLLCTEQFYLHKPVYCRTGQLRTCKMYIAYIIHYCICFPLCAHILFFDAAKISIKLFSFIYLTVTVVRQWDEYEIVIETWPIKTSLHNQLSLPRC